jgi:hypothetical protein
MVYKEYQKITEKKMKKKKKKTSVNKEIQKKIEIIMKQEHKEIMELMK